MSKRHGSRIYPPHFKLFIQDHLTEDALLLWLDGELSVKHAASVGQHVQACWSCRSRCQAIEQSITDLVDYHNAIVAPYLPPPADSRSVFLARLDALVEETGPYSSQLSLSRAFARLFQFLQVHQGIAIVTGIAAVVLVAVSSLQSPSTVSAQELLQLTSDAETRTLNTAVNPIVVQKVRITAGKTSLTRTLYRDVAHRRITSRYDSNRAEENSIKAAYSTSLVEWNSMLDADAYRHWRLAQFHGTDRVVRLRQDHLQLETSFPEGSVSNAELTVRIPDYHAVEETFTFQDHSKLQIAELSYAVVPFASLPVDLFAESVTPADPAAPLTLARIHRALPSRADLVNAQVEAESALHALGADLGEQIRITSSDGRKITIVGVVSNDTRKKQLVSALDIIPHTRVDLLTVDEAAEKAPPEAAIAAQEEPTVPEVIVAAPPLLEARLASRFTDKDQRIAYVNQTLSLAQMASARAWALNRLAERYPASSVSLLGADSKVKLQTLITDHVTALREDLSSLQNQLGEVLSDSSNTPSANTSISEPLAYAATQETAADWRNSVRRIHSSTEAVHESVASLLTSSQPANAEPIEVNLRTSLTQLQTELQSLDQKLRRNNLQ
jgi:hypothetical protein